MIAFASRASAILFYLLRSRRDPRPYLLPANVCPIVPMTFRKAGCAFRFVDIEPESLVIDRMRCLELVSRKPKGYAGVVFVRTYGADSDESAFFQALKSRDPRLMIVDDRCLCRPALDRRRQRGADVALFSTGHAKYVDLGLGGFAWLADGIAFEPEGGPYRPEALERLERDYKRALGGGVRLECSRGPWLDLREPRWTWSRFVAAVEAARSNADRRKERINAVYEQGLPKEIRLPQAFQGWRFQIRVPRPDRFVGELFDAGLFASRHYAPASLVFGGGRFPNAEALHRAIVNLFNDRYYDEERAGRTVGLALEHLAREGRRGPHGGPRFEGSRRAATASRLRAPGPSK
jgi:hypothetical protein